MTMPRARDRRQFLRNVALLAAGASVPGLWTSARARAKGARVVVVGGGFAGATCAKYLRRADPSIQVTLVERERQYITGPFSNLVLAGVRTLKDLTLSYDRLMRDHEIDVVNGEAVAIDPPGHRITLRDRSVLAYDRLVVAPGMPGLKDGPAPGRGGKIQIP